MSSGQPVLFIQAMNIHYGGGFNLLLPLLRAVPAEQRVTVLIDTRAPLPADLPAHLEVRRVPSTVMGRWRAERWLRDHVSVDDLVLCFGNLPPLQRLRAHVIVFVQNRYLVDAIALRAFKWRPRLRLALERVWLRRRAGLAAEFVVQTPTMQQLVCQALGRPRDEVHVWPYSAQDTAPRRAPPRASAAQASPALDFLYAASGDPHKNHRRLIDAWCLLAQQGLRPGLALTLDDAVYPELCAYLASCRRTHDLAIANLGFLKHDELLGEYRRARALIYPSVIESFGLPLIEAHMAGLPVLAGELDYVRDVLDPVQSFDPHSAVSIARAVKRFLDQPEAELPMLSAATFLSRVLDVRPAGAPRTSETMPA